jgi:hypothetical protein
LGESVVVVPVAEDVSRRGLFLGPFLRYPSLTDNPGHQDMVVVVVVAGTV